VGDWVAVANGAKRFEYTLKPLALALLTGAALAFHGNASTGRWAFAVVAQLLSLAGDVFLMLPADLFVPGLASFLLAHLAYVVAFNQTAPPAGRTAAAAIGVLTIGTALYMPIRRGAVRKGHPELSVPLAVYLLAIAAMVVSAIGTAGRADWTAAASALAVVGAALFFVSDALIGWTRFVGSVRRSPVLIIVTYHVGQVLLTLALVGTVANS
jgi:uncharacterized membrane protein YhhN